MSGRPSALTIDPITASIGAEVHGVDLAVDLAQPSVAAAIKQAFVEHHVLVFRNQSLDRQQHKAFGRLFGPLHIHPSQRRPDFDGDPEIFVVEADHKTVLNNGGLWHTDVSCDAVPPLGSVLLLTDAPTSGGDTLFTNMHAAFETLSEPIRRMLLSLRAQHDQRQDLRRYGYEPRAGVDYPATSHPVVVVHPDSGRPLLYVNAAFTTRIEGLSDQESKALLDLLFAHIATNPVAQCRIRWEAGTLTLWDNRCTQHYAVWDYFPEHRRGERVTIAGSEPPRAASVDMTVDMTGDPG